MLHGGASHGKMLHRVDDRLSKITVKGEGYALGRRLTGDIFVFSTHRLGAQDADQLREWERLLSEVGIFGGTRRARSR